MTEFDIISGKWPAQEFQIRYKTGEDKDGNPIHAEKEVKLTEKEFARLLKGEHKGLGVQVDSSGTVSLQVDVMKEADLEEVKLKDGQKLLRWKGWKLCV